MKTYGVDMLASHKDHEDKLIRRGMFDESLVIVDRKEWAEVCEWLNSTRNKVFMDREIYLDWCNREMKTVKKL